MEERILYAHIKDGNGKDFGAILCHPRKFKTGSVGNFGSGKITDPENPGNRYQVTATLVLIGSRDSS